MLANIKMKKTFWVTTISLGLMLTAWTLRTDTRYIQYCLI